MKIIAARPGRDRAWILLELLLEQVLEQMLEHLLEHLLGHLLHHFNPRRLREFCGATEVRAKFGRTQRELRSPAM